MCACMYVRMYVNVYTSTYIYHYYTRRQKLGTSCRLAYKQISPTGFLPPCLPESVLAFCKSLCALCMIHTMNTGDKGIVV